MTSRYEETSAMSHSPAQHKLQQLRLFVNHVCACEPSVHAVIAIGSVASGTLGQAPTLTLSFFLSRSTCMLFLQRLSGSQTRAPSTASLLPKLTFPMPSNSTSFAWTSASGAHHHSSSQSRDGPNLPAAPSSSIAPGRSADSSTLEHSMLTRLSNAVWMKP